MCTRTQGQFAHAATLGALTIVVTQAQRVRYNYICASEPETVCTLLAASPSKLVSLYSVFRFTSGAALMVLDTSFTP